MEAVENYLQILEDSLGKKLVLLTKLTGLTKKQNAMLQEDEFDEDAFQQIVVEKATAIEELTKLDEGFDTLYDRIKEQIENNRDAYREQIVVLQTRIRLVMDQSASLERLEHTNKELFMKRYASLRKEARKVKQSREMASNYYKTMNKISSEAQFMDQKK